MVLLNDIKYACETCIKGHRSSTCSHTDRPLFEIKKKGRPVTQCEHCRQLRKTKQVHVKCVCQFKEGSEATPPTQPSKKGAKVPECPTFPAGLPQGLCASMAPQSAASSDVGHGVHKSCSCDQDSVCNCCTPRVRAPRKRAQTIPEVRQDDSVVSAGQGTRHALPRPILPKAKAHSISSSSSAAGHMTDMVHGSGRHHIHEHAHFSPYGRAYEYSHGHELAKVQGVNSLRSYSPSSHDGPLDNQLPGPLEPPIPLWDPLPPVYDTYIMPMCGCGDDCSCPGCFQHRGQAASSDFALRASSCPNPITCGSCTTSNDISLHPSPDPSFDYAMNFPPDLISNWLAQTMGFESNSFSAPPPFDYDHVLGSTVPWDMFQTPRPGAGNFMVDDGAQPTALWPPFQGDQDMQDACTSIGVGGATNFTEVPRAHSVSPDSSHSSQHASTSFHHLDDTMDESESSSPIFPSARLSSDVQRFLYPWSTTPQRASSSLPDLNAMMAHSCCSATKRMSSVILREASDGIIYAVSSGSSSGSEIGTDDVSLSE